MLKFSVMSERYLEVTMSDWSIVKHGQNRTKISLKMASRDVVIPPLGLRYLSVVIVCVC